MGNPALPLLGLCLAAAIASPSIALAQTNSISGQTWFDQNGDGFVNPGEPPIENVIVNLFDDLVPCSIEADDFGVDHFGQSKVGELDCNISGPCPGDFYMDAGGQEALDLRFRFYFDPVAVQDSSDQQVGCPDPGPEDPLELKRIQAWTMVRNRETGTVDSSAVQTVAQYVTSLARTTLDPDLDEGISLTVNMEGQSNPAYFDAMLQVVHQEWYCPGDEWRPIYDYSWDSSTRGVKRSEIPVFRSPLCLVGRDAPADGFFEFLDLLDDQFALVIDPQNYDPGMTLPGFNCTTNNCAGHSVTLAGGQAAEINFGFNRFPFAVPVMSPMGLVTLGAALFGVGIGGTRYRRSVRRRPRPPES